MEQEVAQKFWPLAELAREEETGGAAGEPGSGGELGARLPGKIKHFSSINPARGKALRLFER
jgi:hypothetical protein